MAKEDFGGDIMGKATRKKIKLIASYYDGYAQSFLVTAFLSKNPVLRRGRGIRKDFCNQQKNRIEAFRAMYDSHSVLLPIDALLNVLNYKLPKGAPKNSAPISGDKPRTHTRNRPPE